MILDRFRLDNQVAVITGGGRGLGAAIALAFAVLLAYFGFIAATAVFIPILMLLMGARSPIQISLTTVGVIAVIWVFFVLIFNNELPPPSLFE